MATTLSDNDVIKMISSLSNRGRWGADDQLGTINLITPAKRKRAAALVQDGVPVSCARPIVTDEISADTTIRPVRFMVDFGEVIDNGNLQDLAEACVARRRWEFLLTIAPLRLQHTTGSPVNPIALF